MSSTTKSRKKRVINIILVLIVAIAVTGINLGLKIFGNNISKDHKGDYLFIPTGSTFEDLDRIIERDSILDDLSSYHWVARIMKYNTVKPGKYKINKRMSNLDFVRMLRSARQEPVKISFHNFRLKSDFVGYISRNLEIDSASFMNLLDSTGFLESEGFNKETSFVIFIPNTYEFFWNTSQEKFFNRMLKEYRKFWNEKRTAQAKKIGLSPVEVSILASIVDQEALINSEMNRIAGVYMNRLHKNMRLEADPTVIFANGDFMVKRVVRKLLQFDSKYNTYRYAGLPPGPICMPSIAAIDAVLHYEKHDYIYFCAKEDFSGTHNYASTFKEHMVNARKFQRALNQRGIMN